MTAFTRRTIFITLFFACTAVYWPGLWGGFVLDDFPNIVRNDDLKIDSLSANEIVEVSLSSDSGPLGRPLSMLSFALERYFFGLNPMAMKLTNIAIHAVNAWLVFLLVQMVLRHLHRCKQPDIVITPTTLAAVTASVWAVSPINLTVVLYIVQRMESLATLFMLGGLLAYMHGRLLAEKGHETRGLSWAVSGVIGGTALGLTAKESAVMLPVYALLIEAVAFRFGTPGSALRRRLLWLYAIVLVAPGLLGAARYLPGILSGDAYANRPFTLEQRLLTEARIFWHYIAWSFVPTPKALSLYHDTFRVSTGLLTPWTTLPAIAGLGAVTVSAIAVVRRAPLVTIGVLWFFVMHLLVSTVFPLELVYEHRNYLGSVGAYLALFALVFRSWSTTDKYRLARTVLTAAIFSLFAGVTILRAHEWGDPFRLAYTEATENPGSPRATYALGKLLMQGADSPNSPSFQLGEETLKEAASLPRAGLPPLQALAILYAKNGLPTPNSTWRRMASYAADNPLSAADTNALFSLIQAKTEGQLDISTKGLGQVLSAAWKNNRDRPLIATLYANYLLNIADEFEKAAPLLKRAVTLAPRSSRFWANLVTYQTATGELSSARNGIERLTELNTLGLQDRTISELRGKLKKAAEKGSGGNRDETPTRSGT